MRVLLVEDDPSDAHITRRMLAKAGNGSFELAHVDCLQDAIDILQTSPLEAVLLDLSLPDSPPDQTLQRIVNCGRAAPVIVLTGNDDLGIGNLAVRNGAQDFLVKGDFDGKSLARSIRYSVERHKAQADVDRLARYDQLTGLANRSTLHDRLAQLVAIGKRSTQTFAVHFVDLDYFKSVNDSLGHAAGDDVLRQSAARLKDLLRRSDTVARIGGDEFVVLQTAIADGDQAATLAAKIVDSFRAPFDLGGKEMFVGASVGTAVLADDDATADELLRNADLALYAAKANGRGACRLYDGDADKPAGPGKPAETRILRAVADGQFLFHFQPIVDAASGAVAGLEALFRWQHPVEGAHAADAFELPIESRHLTSSVTEDCIRSVCWSLVRARRCGLGAARAHINLSPGQLRGGAPAIAVASAIEATGLPGDAVVIEITESAMLSELQQALTDLRDLGCAIAIDDFGTGFASLQNLQSFPIDIIKLAPSFVSPLPDDPASREIASSVIALCRRLGMVVICEGVENADQARFLTDAGADLLQGFHVARPMPIDGLLQSIPTGPARRSA